MKVAILGYGVEGESAYHHFRRLGAEITIHDEAAAPKRPLPAAVAFVGGPDSFARLDDYDLVVRTPPIRPDRIHTRAAVTSVTKLFFEQCQRPIIGVTGTKGKGTTASLIHAILQAAGRPTWLVGNIGLPALDALAEVNAEPQAVAVYELSSFQLWDLDRSPTVAVLLMIEPDHLEVHKDMTEYVAAKANIGRWQSPADLMIHHPDNAYVASAVALSKAQKLAYGQPPAAYIKNNSIMIDEHQICSISELLLPGEHNLENICAAVTAAWRFTQDKAVFKRALSQFSGLPHRLQKVAERAGVSYYDDSISTTAGSAVAAVRAFDSPVTLILGGSDKGVGYHQLAQQLAATGNCKLALCIGQVGPAMAAELQAAGIATELMAETTMPAVVARAAAVAQPGEVVVLSPAAASFDMFKNYADRGDQFSAAVQALPATVPPAAQ